ncbi:MAG: hypothetical protein M1327_02170 [Candidatus Thermoplasmatota archaeon]|nr:hypothetical protein [Candidatus Thermoplasmatota archaeon]
MIDQNGSNSSVLEIEGYIFEYFAASRGYYTLGLNFSMIGNISSSILPSVLLLTYEGSNYSKDNLFVNQLGGCIINNINTTDQGSFNTCYGPFENHTSVQLIEDKNVTIQYRYHFVFSDVLAIDIHPYYIHPTPFNISV